MTTRETPVKASRNIALLTSTADTLQLVDPTRAFGILEWRWLFDLIDDAAPAVQSGIDSAELRAQTIAVLLPQEANDHRWTSCRNRSSWISCSSC